MKLFIEKAAFSSSNVLITGETGVGKEVAARLIHLSSNKRWDKFVKVNCANLNENLIESELFGHHKGSFTGAYIDKKGLIEEARDGTLFLDEIGEVPLNVQAKFLCIIEDKEYRRLGENRIQSIDIRFISATNRDLQKKVEIGRFREDLYYRINVLSFSIPPLRDRKEDIPLLVDFYLKQKAGNSLVTRDGLEKLLSYSYPGNVRELENILERAVIMSGGGEISNENIIFPEKQRCIRHNARPHHNLKNILNALIKYQGNKTKAAKELGISRIHLYRILNKFNE